LENTLTKYNPLIDIRKPLVSSCENNCVSVFHDEMIILEISYQHNDFLELKFSSKLQYKLISPDIGGSLSGKFEYSSIPMHKKQNYIISITILQFDQFFLVMEMDYENDIEYYKTNDYENDFFIKIRDISGFSIKIQYHDILEKYYKTKFKLNKNQIPDVFPGLGIITDFKKTPVKNINFSEIKSFFNTDSLVFMLRNWINTGSKIRCTTSIDSDIDSFIEKMRINNINYILHFTGKIDTNDNPGVNVIRLKDGNFYISDDKYIIDPFSESGRNFIKKSFRYLLDAGASGIYSEQFDIDAIDNEKYAMMIAGDENPVILKDNIKSGLLIFSKIIDELSGEKPFHYSNVIFDKSGSYLYDLDSDFTRSFYDIENYFLQGNMKLSVYIDNEILEKNTVRDISMLFSTLFFACIFFIDYNSIYTILKNNSVKNLVLHTVKLRMSFKLFIENVLSDFLTKGIIPVTNIIKSGELKGFLCGGKLYVAFIRDQMFSQSLFIPDSEYFCFNTCTIVEKSGDFYYKSNREYFIYFQKINSVIPYIPEKNHFELTFPSAVQFYVFFNKNSKVSIIEKAVIKGQIIDIEHDFIIKFSRDKVTLNYSSEEKKNLSRFISFIFISKNKINKVLSAGKRLAVKSISDDCTEFQVINRTNEINIVIEF
jgi:hypothetical protein